MGGGIKSKGLEMGKKIKGWKRRKNKIFKDFTLLTVPKDSIWLLQHYFTLFWPYLYYIYTLWGRKSNNFSTRRGRKSKTRGGERNQKLINFIQKHNPADCLIVLLTANFFEGKLSVLPYFLLGCSNAFEDTWCIHVYHIPTSKAILTMQFTVK